MCTNVIQSKKHRIIDEGMSVACGYFALINVVGKQNASTVYVLTGETACVNMLVSFTELTTSSKTLQALSGMCEFFFVGVRGGCKFQNSTLFGVSDDYTEVRNLISVIQVLWCVILYML
jgi:hypothetical protein